MVLLCLFSKESLSKAQELKFQRINTQDGLSQSGVSDIVQDDLGFMWFATQSGLNRFDGMKFDYFYRDAQKENTLSSSDITRLHNDRNGYIWAMTSHGLDAINQKTLQIKNWSSIIFEKMIANKTFDYKTKGTISDFQVDNDFLYALINYEHLVRVDLETEKLELFDFSNEAIKSISGILVLPTEQILVHAKKCFYFYDKFGQVLEKKYCPREPLDNNRFQTNSLQGNKIFLTYEKGLYFYDYINNREEWLEVFDKNSQSYVEAINVYEVNNGFWLGTVAGLKFYDKNTKSITREYFHQTADDYSLTNNDVLVVFKDKDGALWVGTSFGISLLNPIQPFSHLLRKKEVETFKLSNLATSLTKDSNGNLWIGTSSSGLYHYSNNDGVLKNKIKLNHSKNNAVLGFVSKVFEDDNQNLWVLAGNGLSVKSLNSDKFESLQSFTIDKKYYIYSMLDIIQDRYSNYWLGGSAGLFKVEFDYKSNGEVDLGSIKAINYKDKLPNNYLDGDYGIYIIYEDLQGYIWLGGTNGLVRFNPGNLSVEHFVHEESNSSSLSSTDINTIYEDYNGTLWIGTSNGLNRVYYNDQGNIRFKRIGIKDGFVSEYISDIQADKKGFLWVSTIKGMVRYHPSNTEPVTNYLFQQGLQHDEFYTKSSYTDNHGNLYFGGVNGITMFDPLSLDIESVKKPISFSWITQGQQALTLDKNNIVRVDESKPITIRVSNFDFFANRKLPLRYRLSGSNDWIYLSDPQLIVEHIHEETAVEVQQVSASGLWIEPGINLRLVPNMKFTTVRFWWPLIATFGFLLIATILYWYYSRVRRQHQEKNLSLKREKAKQSLLMEEKLSLLHQVEDLHYSLSEQRYMVDKIKSELEQANIKDEVTGLFSRGYILKNIDYELDNILSTWKQTEQKGIYLGIFCIEIDNYYSLKEQHGYIAANEILRQAAETISDICYGSDIIARWQGASILILSRGISKREQMVLAEKIRNMLASRKFDLSNGKTIDITTSIGFTRHPFFGAENNYKKVHWSKLIFITESALSSAQANSLNAWMGIFSNKFTEPLAIEKSLINDLPELIRNGQIDYVSSIPKSKKIQWD